MFIWNLFMISKFVIYATNGKVNDFDAKDYQIFIITIFANLYIIFLAAKINHHFRKGYFRYLKMKSMIYEIYGYA